MPRRVSLPGASELFRATHPDEPPAGAPDLETSADQDPAANRAARSRQRAASVQQPSGRIRHDEKITVYVSTDELMALEQARLALRRDHGIAVDRGRIVRAALALGLADLAEHDAQSALVAHLSVQ